MESNSRLDHAWWTLRITLGLVPILAGLDKFFNLLTNWEMYLNPLFPRMLHLAPVTFMHIVGVVEMVAGILVLSRLVRFGAYIVMLWLWAIALNLLMMGSFFDIAVRDVTISIGAFALAKLTEVREMGVAGETVRPARVIVEPTSRAA